MGISTYNIATATDKVSATGKELLSSSAGIGGGIAGGAIAGLACGPGAPICVTIGAFVGGALAAFGVHFFGRNVVKLVQTSEVSLRLIGSPFSEGMPQSELILSQEPTGKVIDGAVLEAAIRWHDLLLVFVTDDIMHEETLRIYLFDANLNIVDSAQLGWIYATGVFSLLELCPPNTVRFLFFGDTDWTLELFSENVFVIPFFKYSRGVSRPFRFHRRFQISGNPKPESPKNSMQELRSASIATPNQAEAHIGHDKENRPK